jgi:hypothetical protein
MSITSVKSGATGISLALDNNFMEPIATTLVGSGGVSSIIFNDIPQTYKHLQIRGIARGTISTEIRVGFFIQLNSDTGNNYSRHNIIGDGATVEANGSASQASMFGASWMLPSANAIASNYGAFIIDFLDYTNTTKNKTGRMLIGFDNNGTTGSTGRVGLDSGMWMNTNAITSITILPYANNWSQYSRFSLYGIKG